jgi:hypothetical protein
MLRSSTTSQQGEISLDRQVATTRWVHATFPQCNVTFHRCNVTSPQCISPFPQLVATITLPLVTIGRRHATLYRFSEAFDRGNASLGASKQRWGWCCARRRRRRRDRLRPGNPGGPERWKALEPLPAPLALTQMEEDRSPLLALIQQKRLQMKIRRMLPHRSLLQASQEPDNDTGSPGDDTPSRRKEE